jgi:hypothetical protein
MVERAGPVHGIGVEHKEKRTLIYLMKGLNDGGKIEKDSAD